MTAKSKPSTNGQHTANGKHRQRREWAPDNDDHFIYYWVKFRGESQTVVANQMHIHQSTVSRIIDRYERWQSRAAPREGGRLDHDERLRAQRWVTFERNELILASCLKLAEEMTYSRDVNKVTTSRPLSQPGAERELRQESSCVDRSANACRFLRLAFRVNLEQLKLSQLDPLPPLPPLSAEELAEEERVAAFASDELAAVRQEASDQFDELRRQRDTEQEALNQQIAQLKEVEEAERAELVEQLLRERAGQQSGDGEQGAEDGEQGADLRCAEPLNLHNLHETEATVSVVSDDAETTCDLQPATKKSPRATRMSRPRTPRWQADSTPARRPTNGKPRKRHADQSPAPAHSGKKAAAAVTMT